MSGDPHLGGIQWEQYNHQAMWDMVESADPKELLSRADDLDALAKRMGDNVNAVYKAMAKLMSAWSGPAAERSAAVVQPLLNWASGAATTGSEIAVRLGRYAEALNRARLAMPSPVDVHQLNAVAQGDPAIVNNLNMNEPELVEMAHGDTATQAQATAAKATAVDVMRRFEREAESAYRGMPTFTKPPKVGSFPSPEPMPEPPVPPIPPPPRPRPPAPPTVPTTTRQPPGDPGDPAGNTGTTASDYLGSAGLGPGLGVAGPGGGAATSGVGSGLPVSGVGSGGVIGMTGFGLGSGPLSGVGAESAEQRAGALAAGEATAEQAGWDGFAPMGPGGRSGDGDREHRNAFAEEPNLIGELPPAFPPVLGL